MGDETKSIHNASLHTPGGTCNFNARDLISIVISVISLFKFGYSVVSLNLLSDHIKQMRLLNYLREQIDHQRQSCMFIPNQKEICELFN